MGTGTRNCYEFEILGLLQSEGGDVPDVCTSLVGATLVSLRETKLIESLSLSCVQGVHGAVEFRNVRFQS